MIQKKYILASLAMISLACIGLVNANETSSDNGYKTPIITDKFNFKASLDGTKVNMEWNRFDSFSEESLTYYKVVRSSTKSNPVYPDDGYIKYDTDMGFTSYKDSEPKLGINYYRVCAITNDRNRYCSNVVKIELKSNVESKINKEGKEIKKEVKEVKNEIKKDDSLNKKVEALILKFKAKLTEKFDTDNAKKLTAINTAITRLEALKIAKPHMKIIIDLVIEKLKLLLTEIDTQDIENILNLE